MNSSELLDQFRSDVQDTAEPPLWGDEELLRWLDDAQKWFCRLTDGIADASTVSVCRVNVVAGTDWYSISPLITQLRRATRVDTGAEIRLLNMEKAPLHGVRFDGKPGPLNTFVTGLESHKLRAWPVPSENVTVELIVFRLPLETIDDRAQELEIDEQHHLALLDWVKRCAYLRDDPETYDKRKADNYEQRFRNYCENAKHEQTRARRQVGTVAYGGI